MTRYHFLFAFLFCTHIAQGQEEIRTHKWEIGLNISHVLANVFNSDIDRTALDDYTLVIKRRVGKQSFLRLHLGGDFSDESPSVFDNFRITSVHLQSKLGVEFRRPIAGKFMLLYGADAVGRWASEESQVFTSTITRTEEKSIAVGLSAFLGFGFAVTDRIFITTETALFGSVASTTTDVFENGSGLRVDQRTNYFARHTLPISLYLFVRL